MMWSFLIIIVTLVTVRRRNFCKLYFKLLSQVRMVGLGRMWTNGGERSISGVNSCSGCCVCAPKFDTQISLFSSLSCC